MIDNFALGLTHGLMLLAAWRLLFRRDLEDDSVPPPGSPSSTRSAPAARERSGA